MRVCLGVKGSIELHHLMLAMPVGVEKTRPIRKTGVIDEMIHLKILRNHDHSLLAFDFVRLKFLSLMA